MLHWKGWIMEYINVMGKSYRDYLLWQISKKWNFHHQEIPSGADKLAFHFLHNKWSLNPTRNIQLRIRTCTQYHSVDYNNHWTFNCWRFYLTVRLDALVILKALRMTKASYRNVGKYTKQLSQQIIFICFYADRYSNWERHFPSHHGKQITTTHQWWCSQGWRPPSWRRCPGCPTSCQQCQPSCSQWSHQE